MNEVKIRGKVYAVPAAWQELTRADLLLLGNHFPLIPTYEKTLSLLFGFLKVNKRPLLQYHLWDNFRIAKRLSTHLGTISYYDILSDVIDQLDYFNWIFKDNTLSTTLIDRFRIGFTYYYGPGDKLNNLEIQEFGYADAFFTAYHKSKDTGNLDRMIACLYRPKGEGHYGDKRGFFFEEDISERARTFSQLNFGLKHAIYLNYLGQRNYLINSKPGQAVFTTGKSSGNNGWGQVILKLAGGKFGDYEKTKRTMLWDVLRDIALQKERQ